MPAYSAEAVEAEADEAEADVVPDVDAGGEAALEPHPAKIAVNASTAAVNMLSLVFMRKPPCGNVLRKTARAAISGILPFHRRGHANARWGEAGLVHPRCRLKVAGFGIMNVATMRTDAFAMGFFRFGCGEDALVIIPG